jgi:PAS domain S-box-containing protein
MTMIIRKALLQRDSEKDPHARALHQLLATMTALSLIAGAEIVYKMVQFDLRPQWLGIVLAIWLVPTATYIFRNRLSFFVKEITVFFLIYIMFLNGVLNLGLAAPVLFLAAFIPLYALLLHGQKIAFVHLGLVLSCLILVGVLSSRGMVSLAVDLHAYNQSSLAWWVELITAGLVVTVFIMQYRPMAAALRANEERLRAIFDSVNDAIFIYDLETVAILDVNQRMCEMFGYEKEEVLKIEIGAISAGQPPYTQDGALHYIQKAAAGQPQLFEWRAKHRDGHLFWVDVNMRRAAINGVDRLMLTVRDITDRKKSDGVLQAAQERILRQHAVVAEIAVSPELVSGDIRALVAQIDELTSRALGVERVGVWFFDGMGDELRCIDVYEKSAGRHSGGAVLRQHEYEKEFEALRTARYVDANDPLNDPRTAGYIQGYLKPLHITSMLDAVIRKSGQNLGIICFAHVNQAHHWEEDEISFACQIADQIALAVMNRERKLAAGALSRESEINAALAEVSALLLTPMSIEDISSLVLKHAQAFTGSEYGFVAYIDPGTGYLISPTLTRDIWECRTRDKEVMFKEFRGLWGWVLNNKKPLLTNSPSDDPRSSGTPEGHPRIHRFVSVPALSHDVLIGQIVVANSDRDYTQEDIALLERFASLYSLAIQRIRLEETIQESNRRYVDILNDTQDLIQSVRPDGTFDYVNNAWLRTMGYSEEEVKTLKVFDIIHPDNLSHCKQLFARVMSGESLKDVEPAYVTKDRKKILLRGNIVPRFIEGKVIGTHVFFKDITDEEKAKEFTKKILDAVDEAFIVVDSEYRITNANGAFCGQAKRPLDEIIGNHCYAISHGIDRPCFEVGEDCAVRHTFQTGEPHTVVHTHHPKDRTSLYVETKSFPLRQERGTVLSAIEIINDVTEKKKLEDQLRQSQKMEAIGTLAGGIAHDFNNILTAIMGYGNIVLKKMAKDDLQRVNVQHVLEAADRAAHLTKDLLVFSRKQVVDKRPVDLNEIVRKVEKFLVRVIGEDIFWTTTLRGEPLWVLADAYQLEEILMNLATNAKDAMPQGGMFTITTEQVQFDAEFTAVHGYGKPGMYALVSVSDTGMGMDEGTRRRIFEPFFTTKEVGKGTGLGLAVVYGIIEQHDGYIHVYSEPDKGTTFRIYLPLIASGVMEQKKAPEAERSLTGYEAILLAEDDKQVRDLNASVLQEFGYTVITAVDGEDAVKKYRENKDRIQLLLFDLIMPKKSGKEAYDEIRKISPDVKVLFESGYAPDIIRQKVLLDDHLPMVYKPISPTDLLEKVRRVLGDGVQRIEA